MPISFFTLQHLRSATVVLLVHIFRTAMHIPKKDISPLITSDFKSDINRLHKKQFKIFSDLPMESRHGNYQISLIPLVFLRKRIRRSNKKKINARRDVTQIICRRSRFLEERFRWHPHPENFKISSPRKRDYRHSKAKSACFNISLFKNVSNLVMNFYGF